MFAHRQDAYATQKGKKTVFSHRLESCATQIVLCGGWELVSRALRYKIKFDNLIPLRNTGKGAERNGATVRVSRAPW